MFLHDGVVAVFCQCGAQVGKLRLCLLHQILRGGDDAFLFCRQAGGGVGFPLAVDSGGALVVLLEGGGTVEVAHRHLVGTIHDTDGVHVTDRAEILQRDDPVVVDGVDGPVGFAHLQQAETSHQCNQRQHRSETNAQQKRYFQAFGVHMQFLISTRPRTQVCSDAPMFMSNVSHRTIFVPQVGVSSSTIPP